MVERGVKRADLAEVLHRIMIAIEDLYEPEWVDWFLMTPQERWEESAKLWHHYMALHGFVWVTAEGIRPAGYRSRPPRWK
jgi:hypothetical protein